MTTFTLPPDAEATAPPEWHGLQRDEVRLMAVRPDGLTTVRFRDLPELLEPGDLVVLNTSGTLPARLEARRADGVVVPLHWSTALDDGGWLLVPVVGWSATAVVPQADAAEVAAWANVALTDLANGRDGGREGQLGTATVVVVDLLRAALARSGGRSATAHASCPASSLV